MKLTKIQNKDFGFTCSAGDDIAIKKDIVQFLNVPESTLNSFLRKHKDSLFRASHLIRDILFYLRQQQKSNDNPLPMGYISTPYSANLALTSQTLERLRLKHGEKLEHWWQQQFGFGLDCLTESD
jgi:phosphatidate phosphatase PAH1